MVFPRQFNSTFITIVFSNHLTARILHLHFSAVVFLALEKWGLCWDQHKCGGKDTMCMYEAVLLQLIYTTFAKLS